MSDALHKRFDLDRLTGRVARVEGHVTLAELHRLRELHDAHGDGLFASLEFDADTPDRVLVNGRIRGSLKLTCQRCLEDLVLQLDRVVALAVIDEEQMSGDMPSGFEPYLPAQNSVCGLEIVEEELILALPMSPIHESESECGQLLEKVKESISSNDGEGDASEGSTRPFEILKTLKKN